MIYRVKLLFEVLELEVKDVIKMAATLKKAADREGQVDDAKLFNLIIKYAQQAFKESGTPVAYLSDKRAALERIISDLRAEIDKGE